jgi:DNA-binding response OmpR family regulator
MAKRILIVDDDASVRRALARMLSVLGYETLQADGGATALRILSEASVDLVLSDYAMPKMNGVELVCELRLAGHRMPIVMISGTPGDVSDTTDIVALLGKPTEMAELQATLERALSS